jgi:methionyl-tRNA formyltransferase
MTIGLLVSGNLGNIILNDLIKKDGVNLLFVLTDFGSTAIIQSCHSNNIPVFKGNPRGNKAVGFLSEFNSPDVILSVNYLFIVERDVIEKASKYAINIHGSLLPKFRGRTPHVWAIINGEKMTGVTAHIIEEGCDEGEVVIQKKVPILDSYTGQDLLNVFNNTYPVMVDEIIEKIKTNSIVLSPQDNSKATFFEKRTAEDGKIIFDWQKERIYNWVRAQASPYPGAFGFIGAHKISIHRVEFSDMGFSQNMPNGLVLKAENNIIYFKTQNGVLKIVHLESDYDIKTGDILT